MQKGLSPRLREYISSPRFIHDYLVEQMDGYVAALRGATNSNIGLAPMMFFWPKKRVVADDGGVITHLIIMELKPEDAHDVVGLMKQGAERVNAFAVGLFSPAPDQLKVVLESEHGSETWLMPRQQRGDVLFATEPQRQSNVDSLGVFRTQD